MAEAGAKLEEIHAEIVEISKNMGTMSVCLRPGSRPGRPPMFDLGPNEIELGFGMDGEIGKVISVSKISSQVKTNTYQDAVLQF
jgi:dihydroxyacetone kinase